MNDTWHSAQLYKDFFSSMVGMSTSGSGTSNSEAISKAFVDGGTQFILEPGTYTLATWPTGAAVGTAIYIGAGVTLSDGGSSITGPMLLQAGLWPNGKVAEDGTTTATVNTVTSTAINFTQADIGKLIVVRSTVTGTTVTQRSTIVSVAGNVATCANVMPATIAGVAAIAVGTDCRTPLTNLLAAFTKVELPRGVYLLGNGSNLVIRDGCSLSGVGSSLPRGYRFNNQGTSIIGAGTFGNTGVIDVGVTTAWQTSMMKSTMSDLHIDGLLGYNDAVVRQLGASALVENCTFQGGGLFCVHITGIGAVFRNNDTHAQGVTADNVRVVAATDVVVEGNLIWGCASGGAMISFVDASAFRCINNHTFWRDDTACNQVRVTAQVGGVIASCLIADNELEVGNSHQISLITTGTGILRSITIRGNQCYHNAGFTDNTFDMVSTNAAATGTIQGITIQGNNATTITAVNYRSIWRDNGVVAATGVILTGNIANGCTNVVGAGGTAAFYSAGNAVSLAAARGTWSAT